MARSYQKRKRTSRRNSSRKRTSSKKQIARRRPTAGNQKAQLLSLATRTSKIERKQSDLRYDRYFHQHIAADSAFAGPYQEWSLVNVSNWSTCFGAEIEAPLVRMRFGMKQLSCQLRIQCKSGTSPVAISYTFLVMTPANQKVHNECAQVSITGGITYPHLDDGLDYIMLHGRVMMNPKRWRIHNYLASATKPLVTSRPASMGASPTHWHPSPCLRSPLAP